MTRADVAVTNQPKSKGRGAPDPVSLVVQPGPVTAQAGRPSFGPDVYGARDGAVPAGIKPLPVDVFTTKDFYRDQQYWTDPRYYRCASPNAMEETWGTIGSPHTGDNFPTTVAWGKCDVDYPVAQIVSPYKFPTAQAHYEALLAEAKSRRGPTQYSYDKPPPNWSGVYNQFGFGSFLSTGAWVSGWNIQAATYLSLLTPEYQKRYAQQMYHDGQNQVQWPGAYCWPEGYLRWYFNPQKWLSVTADSVIIIGRISETLFSQVGIDREFNMDGSVPNLSGDNRQWYGDTIGFWDGDALITWTSNIKGWIAHGWFEWSDKMQAIDIYTPLKRKDNGKFAGLRHETIMYDPDALAKPVWVVQYMEKVAQLNESPMFDWRECIQTLFPIKGQQQPVTPGETIQFTVPDMNGRPWADLWTTYFENGMTAPPGPNDPLAGF